MPRWSVMRVMGQLRICFDGLERRGLDVGRKMENRVSEYDKLKDFQPQSSEAAYLYWRHQVGDKDELYTRKREMICLGRRGNNHGI